MRMPSRGGLTPFRSALLCLPSVVYQGLTMSTKSVVCLPGLWCRSLSPYVTCQISHSLESQCHLPGKLAAVHACYIECAAPVDIALGIPSHLFCNWGHAQSNVMKSTSPVCKLTAQACGASCRAYASALAVTPSCDLLHTGVQSRQGCMQPPNASPPIISADMLCCCRTRTEP